MQSFVVEKCARFIPTSAGTSNQHTANGTASLRITSYERTRTHTHSVTARNLFSVVQCCSCQMARVSILYCFDHEDSYTCAIVALFAHLRLLPEDMPFRRRNARQ